MPQWYPGILTGPLGPHWDHKGPGILIGPRGPRDHNGTLGPQWGPGTTIGSGTTMEFSFKGAQGSQGGPETTMGPEDPNEHA